MPPQMVGLKKNALRRLVSHLREDHCGNFQHLISRFIRDYGYSPEELRKRILSKLKKGMTVDNYPTWHIDHVVPACRFRFTSYSDADFKRCFALENLQPLWARENLNKGRR